MKISLILTGLAVFTCSPFAHAKSSYDSLPAVKKGGNFNDVVSMTPVTFNPLLTTDAESQDLAGQFYFGLFGIDGETYEYYPVLAEKMEVSKDKKTYSFTLNPRARWTDGTPVTSDDIEFTFQKLMDPKVEGAALRGYYEGVTFKKTDAAHFTFTVEHPKFNTLEFISGFAPVQKKQFEKEEDFNKSRENLRPIGTGPYKFKSLSRDQSIVFERDKNWWGKDLPQFKARFNFDTITTKIIQDPTLRYEKLIKGEIDQTTLTSDQFVTQVQVVDKDRIGKSPKDGKSVWADMLRSDSPMGWFGIALNLKDPRFSSVGTRKGLAYLIDYQGVFEKCFYGTMEQSVSPFNSKSNNVAPELKSQKNWYRFDVAKAAEYFKKDGWVHAEGDSFLSKTISGKKTMFKFSLRYASQSPAQGKTAQLLKEIFKKSGVDLDLRPMDMTSLYKDFEDSEFDAIVMAWTGGGMYPDPKQLWSTEAMKGGSNRVSYSNPKVDELIKKANLEFDRKKRSLILQQIGKILYDEVPYIFVGERHFVLQGMNSRIKAPKFIEKFGSSVAKDLFYE